MSETTIPETPTPPVKAKRAYVRRNLTPVAAIAPAAPNPQITLLENDYVGLVRQRQSFVVAVNSAQTKVNQASNELNVARGELQQIDDNIQFIANSIQTMKNGGLPVPQTTYTTSGLTQGQFAGPAYPVMQPSAPYTPVAPYPTMPTFEAGVGSFPAPNCGLYPDATDRLESAEDVRQYEVGRR